MEIPQDDMSSTSFAQSNEGEEAEASELEAAEINGQWSIVSRKPRRKRPRQEVSPIDTPLVDIMDKDVSENTFTNRTTILVAEENGAAVNLNKVSPILIAKRLKESLSADAVTTVKILRNGSIAITASSDASLLEIQVMTELGPWKMKPPTKTQEKTTVKGVISGVHQAITIDEINEALKTEYEVLKVERLSVKSNGTTVPTRSVAIILKATQLPQRIKLGFEVYQVRQFIPDPLQCYKCRRYGHKAGSCESKQRCARCGGPHLTKECSAPRENFKCVNCGGPHSAAFGGCAKRKEISQIIRMSHEMQIPRREAASKIEERKSFAEALKFSKQRTAEVKVQSTTEQESHPAPNTPKTKENTTVKTSGTQTETKQTFPGEITAEVIKSEKKLRQLLEIIIKGILSMDSLTDLQNTAKKALEALVEMQTSEEETPEADHMERTEERKENKKTKKKRKKQRPTVLEIPSTKTIPASRPASR